MKKPERNRQFHLKQVAIGIAWSLVVLLLAPGGIDAAAAQQSCNGDEICEMAQQLNKKLKYIRESTHTMGTLKEALEGTVSFSVCPDWALTASIGLGAGAAIISKGEGGAGAYVLGNGLAGHLKGNTSISVDGKLGGSLGISAFPCINVDELHTVVSGDRVIPVIPTYDIDDGLDPEEECPECGSPGVSWEMDAGLQDDVSRIISDISPVDVLNTVVGLIIEAAAELESGIGTMDEEAIRNIAVALLSGQAVETAFNEASELSQQGGAGIADTALSAFGYLRNMVESSPAGDWMEDTINAFDTISSPNTQQSILESIASPCETFLSYSWCEDAKEIGESVHEVIKWVSKGVWVERVKDLGPLSLQTEGAIGPLADLADNVYWGSLGVNGNLFGLTHVGLDNLTDAQNRVIDTVEDIHYALGAGMNYVKQQICVTKDIDVNAEVCSAWVDVRICEFPPVTWGGSCPGISAF